MICNLQSELPYPFRYIYLEYLYKHTHTHTPRYIYRAPGIFSLGVQTFHDWGADKRMDGWAVRVVGYAPAAWLLVAWIIRCGRDCVVVDVTVALVVGVSDVVATICTASLKIHFMFTPHSRRSRWCCLPHWLLGRQKEKRRWQLGTETKADADADDAEDWADTPKTPWRQCERRRRCRCRCRHRLMHS